MSDDADAVRAHYEAALSRRMQAAPAAVQRVLQARPLALPTLPRASAPPLTASRRPRAAAATTPLGQLNQHIAATTQSPGTAPPELKSARAFRETWSRICAEDDVAEAVQRGPENAGPLNSHRLVLRTLGLLRELSPDYLQRFMAHADTLLWLEQVSTRPKAPAASKVAPARRKK